MTQIAILSGIVTDNAGDIKDSYPINLEPALIDSGISKGYLRTVPGIIPFGQGPDEDRGAILWAGRHVRVMGAQLVTVSSAGVVTAKGSVGLGLPVSMDYSADRLAIASGGNLFYFKDDTVTQLTDPDLGVVLDVLAIDGYFMTTDGTYIVVTNLDDPYAIDPLKYGSAEEDPDPITGLMRLRGEAYAIGRHTIEVLQNTGGVGFPFQRVAGGLIEKGCVAARAKAYFADTFAFIGGGRGEAISVYLAGSGEALPISTPQIDRELALVEIGDQALIECETRIDLNEQRLIVHLPTDKTLVYYIKASLAAQTPVWTILAGGTGGDEAYPVRHLVYTENRFVGGSPSGALGKLDYAADTQFGQAVGWRFDVPMIYNASKGGIVRTLELIGLTGRAPLGDDPTAFMSWSLDGETWSQERPLSTGKYGQSRKRMQWRPGVRFSNFMTFRFRGANRALATFARLEAEVEGLRV